MQSQSSPLTMALLNSQTQPYANMAMYDPSALAGMQRLQLAQGLMGGATDASPAYPMQALSRLGQAIVGALLYKQGNADLEGLGKQRSDEASAALARVAGAGGAEPSMVAQPATQTPQQVAPASSLSEAVHQLESGGSNQPGVTGDGGAAGGVMQVHPAALADVNKAYGTNYTMDQVIADPKIGKWAGDSYLHMMEQRFPGHPELALAAYNAGPTATANAVASGRGVAGLPPSTQQYVAKGMQLAQGGNVATDAIPSPVPGGSATPQQAATQVPAGMSPQTQRILAQMQQARLEMARNPYNLPLQKQLEAHIENLKQQLEVGQWQVGPNGVMINSVTGEQKSAAEPLKHFSSTPNQYGAYTEEHGLAPPVTMPTPRPYTDAHGNVGAVGPGGANMTLATNPSGFHGNEQAQAAQALVELAPKIANGTATEDERNRYSTALTLFQHNTVQTNPATKQLGVMPSVPVPPGLPGSVQPPAPQPQGGPQVTIPPSAPPGFQPMTGSARGPETAQDIVTDQGKKDAAAIAEEQAATMKSHNIYGTTATIRSMLPQVTTGVGADQRTAAGQVLSALGIDPASVKELTGSDTPAAEVLQKKLFELTTGATRAMGAREPGSVMLMFQKNYPQMSSRNMTIDAMTRLIDMDQKYKEDEIGGRQQYLSGQIQGLNQNKPYEGLAGYKQPDPRLYQAAALASGGMPFTVWSQGLTPQQQTEALKLAASVYPDASALDAKGVRHVFQRPQGG